MELTIAIFYGVPNGFYDPGQFIGTDVGMGIDKNIRNSAMLNQYGQNFFDIPPFCRPGIQFAVTISSCPALAKTKIGVWVYLSL